jgi:putative peptidoglycan lipid II flippase
VDSDKASSVTVTQTRQATNRSAVTLMIGTLASRFTGFLSQSLLNQLFSKDITDAFGAARRIPYLLRELLAEGALTSSFIPAYKSLSKDEAKKFSSALLSLLIAFNALLLVAVYFLSPWIVDLMLGQKGNIDRALVKQLTPLTFPVLAMVSLSAWAMGILNAEEKFFAPAWAPASLNIVTVILMLVFPQNAPMLAIGLVIGGLAQFLVQIPSIVKGGFVSKFQGLWHPKIKDVLLLMFPSIFSTSGRQILNLATTNIIAKLPPGSLTSFYNADLFLSMALGLFAVSPTMAYYARLNDNAVNNPEKFNTTLLSGLQFISFMSIPGGLFLTVFARPIIESVFNWLPLLGRPGADQDILLYSSLLLAPLGLTVFPISILSLISRTFFIRRKIVFSILFSLGFLVFQGALNYMLTALLGIAGLSWALVIMTWTQFVALLLIVARRENFTLGGFINYALRAWSAALIAMALSALILLIPGTSWLINVTKVVCGLIAFVGLYLAIGRAFKLPEVDQILRRLKR